MSTWLGRRWRPRDWVVAGLAMAIAVALTATLTAAVVDSIAARRDTHTQLIETRDAYNRRIDLLQDDIAVLTGKVAAQAVEVGRARQSIAVLERQIRQLGGQPVTTTGGSP